MTAHNIFETISSQYFQLTNSEKKVADYAVIHQQKTQFMSISELAEEAGLEAASWEPLLYLNTSSIKAMMDIFDLLEEAHRKGRQVSVRWSYDGANERVGELAAEFKEDCTFPFDIAAKV